MYLSVILVISVNPTTMIYYRQRTLHISFLFTFQDPGWGTMTPVNKTQVDLPANMENPAMTMTMTVKPQTSP